MAEIGFREGVSGVVLVLGIALLLFGWNMGGGARFKMGNCGSMEFTVTETAGNETFSSFEQLGPEQQDVFERALVDGDAVVGHVEKFDRVEHEGTYYDVDSYEITCNVSPAQTFGLSVGISLVGLLAVVVSGTTLVRIFRE